MPLGRENHGNDVASCQEVDGRPSCPGEVTFEHLVKKSRQLCRLEGSRLPLCVKCFGTALLIVILCLQIWASLDDSRLKPSRRRLPNGNFLFPSFFLHLFTGIHSFTQLSTDPSFGLMHPGLILRITVFYSCHFFFRAESAPNVSIRNWASRLRGPSGCHHFGLELCLYLWPPCGVPNWNLPFLQRSRLLSPGTIAKTPHSGSFTDFGLRSYLARCSQPRVSSHLLPGARETGKQCLRAQEEDTA